MANQHGLSELFREIDSLSKEPGDEPGVDSSADSSKPARGAYKPDDPRAMVDVFREIDTLSGSRAVEINGSSKKISAPMFSEAEKTASDKAKKTQTSRRGSLPSADITKHPSLDAACDLAASFAQPISGILFNASVSSESIPGIIRSLRDSPFVDNPASCAKTKRMFTQRFAEITAKTFRESYSSGRSIPPAVITKTFLDLIADGADFFGSVAEGFSEWAPDTDHPSVSSPFAILCESPSVDCCSAAIRVTDSILAEQRPKLAVRSLLRAPPKALVEYAAKNPGTLSDPESVEEVCKALSEVAAEKAVGISKEILLSGQWKFPASWLFHRMFQKNRFKKSFNSQRKPDNPIDKKNFLVKKDRPSGPSADKRPTFLADCIASLLIGSANPKGLGSNPQGLWGAQPDGRMISMAQSFVLRRCSHDVMSAFWEAVPEAFRKKHPMNVSVLLSEGCFDGAVFLLESKNLSGNPNDIWREEPPLAAALRIAAEGGGNKIAAETAVNLLLNLPLASSACWEKSNPTARGAERLTNLLTLAVSVSSGGYQKQLAAIELFERLTNAGCDPLRKLSGDGPCAIDLLAKKKNPVWASTVEKCVMRLSTAKAIGENSINQVPASPAPPPSI